MYQERGEESRQRKYGGVVESQGRRLELWRTWAERVARKGLEHRIKASWG